MSALTPTYRQVYVDNHQLGPLEVFTRNSRGECINYMGNFIDCVVDQPRFDYDPVALACRGLLMEPAGENVFLNSGLPDGPGSVTSYTGPLTSTTMAGFPGAIAFPAGRDYAYAQNVYNYTKGSDYTLSVFVEMDDGLAPNMPDAFQAGSLNDFGVILFNQISQPQAATVTPMGGRLYRVSVRAYVGPSSDWSGNFGIYRYDTNTGRGFKTSGWQLENWPRQTSYMPSGSTTGKRANSQITVKPAQFSQILRAEEGTVVFRGRTSLGDYSGETFISLNDGTASNSLIVSRAPLYTAKPSEVIATLTIQGNKIFTASLGTIGLNDGQRVRVAVSYAAGQWLGALNGKAMVLSNSASAPAFNQLNIGCDRLALIWGGHVISWETHARAVSLARLIEVTL